MLLAVPLPSDYDGQQCALARSLEVVGERWTLLILRDLFFGVRRFGELQARLDIPRAVLSARLATLVERGLVERRPYRRGRDEFLPDRARGRAVAGDAFADALGRPSFRALAAAASCSPMRPAARTFDAAGRCPACEVMPPAGDVETRPGPGAGGRGRDDAASQALREPHRLLTRLELASG